MSKLAAYSNCAESCSFRSGLQEEGLRLWRVIRSASKWLMSHSLGNAAYLEESEGVGVRGELRACSWAIEGNGPYLFSLSRSVRSCAAMLRAISVG